MLELATPQDGVRPQRRPPLGTLSKVGRVLDLYTVERPEWGVRELACELGISRSNAHTLLSSLEAINILRRTPDSRYRLGWRLLALAGGVQEASILRRVAPRRMRALADVGGQSTHLAVWDGREMFFFARAVAAKGVAVVQATPGTTLPAHATASGKVLLGHLRNEGELRAMLGGDLPRLSARTIVDEGRLWKEVETAQARGVAISRDETVMGIEAAAVPVRGADGRVLAALGVSMPTGQLDRYLTRYRRHLESTAAAITTEVRRATTDHVRATVRGLALEV
jgi:DNA-binding IclR family transcriptional regulator